MMTTLCRCQRSRYLLRCSSTICLARTSVVVEDTRGTYPYVHLPLRVGFKKVWSAFVKKMYSTFTLAASKRRSSKQKTIHDQIRKPKVRSEGSKLRKWARRSLAKRFCPGNPGDTHKKSQPARLGESELPSKLAVWWKSLEACTIQDLGRIRVGLWSTINGSLYPLDSEKREIFEMVLRKSLRELGILFLGPIPTLLLELIWARYGEGWWSIHTSSCFCHECAGSTRVYGIWISVGNVLFNYLKQMPVHVVLSLIIPVPLKCAWFGSTKLWQWIKVLFPHSSRYLRDSLRLQYGRSMNSIYVKAVRAIDHSRNNATKRNVGRKLRPVVRRLDDKRCEVKWDEFLRTPYPKGSIWNP